MHQEKARKRVTLPPVFVQTSYFDINMDRAACVTGPQEVLQGGVEGRGQVRAASRT